MIVADMLNAEKHGKNNFKRVVIVGGGFAGLNAAKVLAGQSVSVTLIDRKNFHTFQPLLYQVATAVLSPGQIAQPLRRILYKAPNVKVIMGEIVGFDLKRKVAICNNGVGIPYDYLIVAAGARHAYFGHDKWEFDAPGLKTIEDALEIRRRILLAFELAEREACLTGKHQPLHFAVIGGGPTGVELAGAIANIAKRSLSKDFKCIDFNECRITLYEGATRILGIYPERISHKAQKQLSELGVEVQTNSFVMDIEPGRIKIKNKWIPANVSLWASGIEASRIGRKLDAKTEGSGRVFVEPDLSLPGHPEVFVVGDMSLIKNAEGQTIPALGAPAMQEGRSAARNILRDTRNQKRINFLYKDRGSMATIGRHRAVAEIGKWYFSGYFAWFIWALVHIFMLMGFRHRVAVFYEWIWTYFTRERSARLITGNIDELAIQLTGKAISENNRNAKSPAKKEN
ncbi:MAG: NAD(P)/FAD-dependent oxidoreductase [Spirochaetia bacterium]|nr:NAD(P)/FAD-dependent oxidoreductase [Spirochaetia bacterium]